MAVKDYTTIPVIQRFETKYAACPMSGCWIWTSSVFRRGYGKFFLLVSKKKPRTRLAHRVSYELHIGAIPHGMSVLHKCDNTSCVNPAHLFLGTHSDNMRDMAEKKRAPYGENSRRHKLKANDVLDIRKRAGDGESPTKLATEYGISRSQVRVIFNHTSWKWLNDD